MYRFDDKWRRRLLEDALVADLLDGPAVQTHEEQSQGPATAPGPSSGGTKARGLAPARKPSP
jgi:hypothetical protein